VAYHYSPREYGSIRYKPLNSNDHETYEVSARDNKIIVKNSYDSGSIGEILMRLLSYVLTLGILPSIAENV
jgi:hypothetical protein